MPLASLRRLYCAKTSEAAQTLSWLMAAKGLTVEFTIDDLKEICSCKRKPRKISGRKSGAFRLRSRRNSDQGRGTKPRSSFRNAVPDDKNLLHFSVTGNSKPHYTLCVCGWKTGILLSIQLSILSFQPEWPQPGEYHLIARVEGIEFWYRYLTQISAALMSIRPKSRIFPKSAILPA